MSKTNGNNRFTQGEGNPQKIKVLLYHRILSNGNSEDSTNIGVSKETFRRQIDMLDRWGYTAITFDDYRLFLEGELNLPKKPIIITFDDAYSDIHEVAMSILREYGMKAVVFVVGDLSIRESVWDESIGPVHTLLTESQILELHEEGFEIGSHTLSHPKLPNIDSERVWEELTKSRIALEILLNSPVRSFAYPYGLTSKTVKQMVYDSGYTVACGAYSGPPLFGFDYFEIRRIKVRNTSNPIQFWFQLQKVYLYYRWFLWKAKSRVLGVLNRTQDKETPEDPVAIKHSAFVSTELVENSE